VFDIYIEFMLMRNLESMAELSHRPLYIIGGGELGHKASYAELSLRATFKRAEAWGDSYLALG
jgi:hypothetical protein